MDKKLSVKLSSITANGRRLSQAGKISLIIKLKTNNKKHTQ